MGLSSLLVFYACTGPAHKIPVPTLGLWMLFTHFPLLLLALFIQLVLLLRLRYLLVRYRIEFQKTSAVDIDEFSSKVATFPHQDKSVAFSVLTLFKDEQFRELTYYQLRPLVKSSFSKPYRLLYLLQRTGQIGPLLGFLYFCQGYAEIYRLHDTSCSVELTPQNLGFLLYGPFGGMLLTLFMFLGMLYFRPLFRTLENSWLWYSHALYNYKSGYSEKKPILRKPSEYCGWLSKVLAKGPVYLVVFIFFPIFFLSGPYHVKYGPLPKSHIPLSSSPTLELTYQTWPNISFPSTQLTQGVWDYSTYLAMYIPSLRISPKKWNHCVSQSKKEWKILRGKELVQNRSQPKNSTRVLQRILGHLILSQKGRIKGFWITLQRPNKPSKFSGNFLYNPPIIQYLPALSPAVESLKGSCHRFWPRNSSKLKASVPLIANYRCQSLKLMSKCLAPTIIQMSQFSPNKFVRWVTFPIPVDFIKSL